MHGIIFEPISSYSLSTHYAMSGLKCMSWQTPQVTKTYAILHHFFNYLGRIKILGIKPESLFQRKAVNTFDSTTVVLSERTLFSSVWAVWVCSTKAPIQPPLGLVRYEVVIQVS